METKMKKPSATLRVFGASTLLSLAASVGCWIWATYKTDKAKDELSQAMARGDYGASSRNEWPALDWFVASFVFLFFAIIVGVIALVGWLNHKNTIDRKK